GAAKKGPREFRRFLDISVGSLAELSVGLRLAKDTGILSSEDYQRLRGKLRDAGRLTSALARSMRQFYPVPISLDYARHIEATRRIQHHRSPSSLIILTTRRAAEQSLDSRR